MKKHKFFGIFFLAGFFLFFVGGAASEIISERYPVSRCIALTFDGGPSPETTPLILQTLAKFGARATFFVTGENAQGYPHILKKTLEMGNEIGNHTYNHPNLSKLGKVAVIRQIAATQKTISSITGREAAVFRPPYGAVNKMTAGLAQSLGLKTIMWSIDTRDWQDPSPQVITNRVLTRAKAGDIVLMHDTRQNTAFALPSILEGLKKQGFQFVTVSELLKK